MIPCSSLDEEILKKYDLGLSKGRERTDAPAPSSSPEARIAEHRSSTEPRDGLNFDPKLRDPLGRGHGRREDPPEALSQTHTRSRVRRSPAFTRQVGQPPVHIPLPIINHAHSRDHRVFVLLLGIIHEKRGQAVSQTRTLPKRVSRGDGGQPRANPGPTRDQPLPATNSPTDRARSQPVQERVVNRTYLAHSEICLSCLLCRGKQ